MRKTIIITSLTLSAILILDSMNAFNEVVFFVIAGKLPGTDFYLDASVLLPVYALLGGIVTGRLSQRLITLISQPKQIRRRA